MNLYLTCLLCLSALSANAATHYLVPTNTAAVNPYTNWATAGTSVIDVLNVAMSNSSTPRTVWVTNGVYILTNTVTITNNVALRGFNGRDTAIFNGNAAWRFVMQHTNCTLDALTITNGLSGSGGGIALSGGTVTNCLITDCVNNPGGPSDASGGGGIRIAGTGIVANCIIRGNVNTNAGGGGGGIKLYSGSSMIENCIIEKNRNQTGHGGGLIIGGDNATVRNCLIRYNTVENGSTYGGGLLITITNAHIINCTIVSNYSWVAAGIGFGVSQTNTVINCVVASNYAYHAAYKCIANIDGYASPAFNSCDYSCSTPLNNSAFFSLTGTRNITNDPGFLDFAGGNYRFSRYSRCFNSGTNQTDWMNSAVDLDGHRRILHGTADMGAYELFIPDGMMFRGR